MIITVAGLLIKQPLTANSHQPFHENFRGARHKKIEICGKRGLLVSFVCSIQSFSSKFVKISFFNPGGSWRILEDPGGSCRVAI